MKELLRMYKESNSVLEKANIWSHIEEKVEELAIEKNPDEYGGSLYLDEDYYINLEQERDAYKRGFIQAIQVLEFEHERPAYVCEHCDIDNNECNILSSCPLELFYVFKKSDKKFEV